MSWHDRGSIFCPRFPRRAPLRLPLLDASFFLHAPLLCSAAVTVYLLSLVTPHVGDLPAPAQTSHRQSLRPAAALPPSVACGMRFADAANGAAIPRFAPGKYSSAKPQEV